MTPNKDDKRKRTEPAPRPTGGEPRPGPNASERAGVRETPAQGLDFSKLDLTVERVDERISPSETNVFDK